MSSMGSMTCPTHSSKLLELKEHKKTYRCDGCEMGGKGPGYGCGECDYVLHSQCMFPSNNFAPSFLQANTFKFMRKPLPPPTSSDNFKRYCDACGIVTKGFVYHCNMSGVDLHPCCAGLNSHLEIDGQRLTLYKENTRKSCELCKDLKSVDNSNKIDSGWFYASNNEDFKCHVYCMMVRANEYGNEDGIDIAKSESLSIVKKRKSDGKKYGRILKAMFTYMIAIVFGDPTLIVAKLLVEGVVHLGELLK